MKKTFLLLFLLATTAMGQQMRDSTYLVPVAARPCVIIVVYGGVQVRDTLSAEQVAAWLSIRGITPADSLSPIQEDIRQHLRAEVGRCHAAWISKRDIELAAVDANDDLSQTQYRTQKTAIRTRYRQWTFTAKKSVPVLDGALQVAPGGEVVR